MNTCPCCGERVIEGALFCTKCGARVEAACQTTSCEESSEAKALREFLSTGQHASPAEDLLAVVKEIFVRPASAVKKAVTGLRMEHSYLLAGILALLQGFFGVGFIRVVMGSFMGFFNSIAGYMGLSYGKVFFCTFAVALISMAVLSAVIYGVSRALGSNCEWLSVWNSVVASAIPYTAGVVMLYLLLYVGRLLGAAAFLYGFFASAFCVHFGSKEATGLSEDKAVYVTSLAYLVMAGAVVAFLRAVLFNVQL